MIKRAILPVLLLMGGVVSLIYGARFHTTPVLEEVTEEVVEQREVEETITIPSPFAPPPEFAQNQPFFPTPPPIVEKVIRKVPVTRTVTKDVVRDELEGVLIREMTVGGVELLGSGQLKRTYSRDSTGGTLPEEPALCPT